MHVFRYSLFLFTAVLLLPAVVRLQAQQPSPPVQRVFHYQGCLTDASGAKITGQRTVRFEIVDLGTSPLAVLFSETVQNLQVEDGINCWDLNGNGVKDPATEDANGDGIVDVNDCKGPKGDPGPPGGVGDTIVVEDLTVTGRSMHEGNEHFRRGITVGGQDSARAKLRIDSTG